MGASRKPATVATLGRLPLYATGWSAVAKNDLTDGRGEDVSATDRKDSDGES